MNSTETLSAESRQLMTELQSTGLRLVSPDAGAASRRCSASPAGARARHATTGSPRCSPSGGGRSRSTGAATATRTSTSGTSARRSSSRMRSACSRLPGWSRSCRSLLPIRVGWRSSFGGGWGRTAYPRSCTWTGWSSSPRSVTSRCSTSCGARRAGATLARRSSRSGRRASRRPTSVRSST